MPLRNISKKSWVTRSGCSMILQPAVMTKKPSAIHDPIWPPNYWWLMPTIRSPESIPWDFSAWCMFWKAPASPPPTPPPSPRCPRGERAHRARARKISKSPSIVDVKCAPWCFTRRLWKRPRSVRAIPCPASNGRVLAPAGTAGPGDGLNAQVAPAGARRAVPVPDPVEVGVVLADIVGVIHGHDHIGVRRQDRRTGLERAPISMLVLGALVVTDHRIQRAMLRRRQARRGAGCATR